MARQRSPDGGIGQRPQSVPCPCLPGLGWCENRIFVLWSENQGWGH